ncbi:MAG: hypothetical protein QG667_1408 [Pseudomonadota bacterium]|nr:hypothetical protein [Pseudomonadota bacterium]
MHPDTEPHLTAPDTPSEWRERHLRRLLDSYRRCTGRELLPLNPSQALAPQLWAAPRVIVSHGTEADPVLNYGNLAALQRWQMPWQQLVSTPSRLTAEPLAREERAALLQRVTEHGYIDDYSGVRIAANGQRFRIRQAVVWNIVDENGVYCGQAASFDQWDDLTANDA